MKLILKNLILFIFAFLCILIGVPVISIHRSFNKTRLERQDYFILLAVNLDYVGGTLLYDSDGKTVSAITGKLSHEEERYVRFESFINWLFDDDNHCFNAYIKEFK